MSGPSNPQAYISLETLIEDVVQAFKDALENIDGIDDISEGETVGEYGAGTTAVWVIPGQGRAIMSSTSSVEWKLQMYVILLSSEEGAKLSDLRSKGYEIFDEFAKDYTKNGTCWAAFPRLFHPGYMLVDNLQYVGVLMQYEVVFYQQWINDSS